MNSNHTFGIDFLIRKCKEDKKKALIYVRITLDNDRKEVSVKEKIETSAWDAKREMVKGNSIQVKQINKTIEGPNCLALQKLLQE